MKAWMIAALAALCCEVAGAEQSVTTHDAILAREEAWARALLAGDLSTVDSIMHRDFRLVRTYGSEPPVSKEAYLAMEGMSASTADVTSVTVLSEVGPTAVARVTWTMDWAQEGVGKLPPHFDMIDTWIIGEDGVWRILSRVSQIADAPYGASSGASARSGDSAQNGSAEFAIALTVNRAENGVRMECLEGCYWRKLAFSCDAAGPDCERSFDEAGTPAE